MLFNTAQFFAFFAAVLLLFYTLPWFAARKWLLLVASYYFYASWNVNFVPLLLTLTLVDYFCARWIEKSAKPRVALIISLSANLGFLAFFKYTNFLASQVTQLTGQPARVFDIVLPLGISFHTFQSISYIVDVYRGQQTAVRSLPDYALFIAFFPQLVAGPIVRARDFFRDLLAWQAPSGEEIRLGAWLMLLGLTKKMAFADRFAIVADGYFGNPVPGQWTAITATLAFGLQIFFDFSGYTDMAIGMAKLLGFHFPENFRRPYLASSITDFWRRWHISLSSWLRDYLYIPLGGSRHGSWRTYRNLLLTMLLGGLWHGASWNFVVWGGYHGLLLGVERAARLDEPRGWLRLPRLALTFVLVMLGWVFFRANGWEASQFVLHEIFLGSRGAGLLNAWQCGLALGALLMALAEDRWAVTERLARGPAWLYVPAFALMGLVLEIFGVFDQAIPFVYFQF
ncbi:MAG: MBOAT family protein [Bryobacteraceae bacterium]|nr:MBOAT family protein [Bryobacteraceae bacterium]